MANLFRDLPHLLGTITNLDGVQSMRTLVSINAELKRRQRLFSENDVNHINQYQKLYKNGDVSEPMPHLFLISDELGELRSEAEVMDAYWTGERPEEIPMVPEELSYEEIIKIKSVSRDSQSSDLFPIGLDMDDAKSFSWDSRQSNLLFGYSESREGDAFGKQIIRMLQQKNQKALLFDSEHSNLQSEYGNVRAVAVTKENYSDLLEVVLAKMEERKNGFENYQQANPNGTQKTYYQSIEQIFIILNEPSKLIENMDTRSVKELTDLISDGHSKGVVVITLTSIVALGKGYDDIMKALKQSKEAILTVRLNDQNVFSPTNKEYREEPLGDQVVY